MTPNLLITFSQASQLTWEARRAWRLSNTHGFAESSLMVVVEAVAAGGGAGGTSLSNPGLESPGAAVAIVGVAVGRVDCDVGA
eukprot:1152588-Pelagomonas_calceolata.AAC.9